MQSGSFSEDWMQAREALVRYCQAELRHPQDVEDTVQEVAVRALRGYATFNRRCTFLTWVMAIARNEVRRHHSRAWQRLLRSAAPLDENRLPPTPSASAAPTNWLAAAVSAAEEANALSPAEVAVLQARLAAPEASWSEIGAALGRSPNECAVSYFRAQRDLRVFLFLRRIDLLGGQAAVAAALESARSELSSEAARIFRVAVFARDPQRLPAGGLDQLRHACGTVIRHLDLPENLPAASTLTPSELAQ